MSVPVITIDGPSGTGKGTVSARLAQALGWHWLDSGVVYRAIAWLARREGTSVEDEQALVSLISRTNLRVGEVDAEGVALVFCDDQEISRVIRDEKTGGLASRLSKHIAVRRGVLQLQRDCCQPPGLVTDGRDMGTVVFPEADLKIYLDASHEERVRRRYAQLKKKGEDVSLEAVSQALSDRDAQDRARAVSPLTPAADAHCIRTDSLSVDDVFVKIMALVRALVI